MKGTFTTVLWNAANEMQPSTQIFLCNARHLLRLVVHSDNLATFIASLRHCCKLVIQTSVYLFKAFHYYMEQCNKNIWFDGTYRWNSCTEIKSLLHFWNAVFADNMKVWNPTCVTKEHVLYEDSFCVHFVAGVSYAGYCVKIKPSYVICVTCLFLSVFFPLAVLQTFF